VKASVAARHRNLARVWLGQAQGGLGRITATPLIPVAVTVALGLWGIGDKSLWLDEGLAIAVARLPTGEMLNYIWRVELHAGVYYLLLHPWLALGQHEGAVRALSVVFALVAVLATWAIGRRFGVGSAAALILATAPAFVIYAQQARPFGLLVAAAAVSSLLYLRMREQETVSRGAAYVASAVFMAYAHPLGTLVVAAHAAHMALDAGLAGWRRVLAVFVPVGLLWLPLVRFALSHRDRMAESEPLTFEWVSGELVTLAGGPMVGAALGALLLLGLWRRPVRDPITLWLMVPLAGIMAISVLIQPSLLGRYLLGTLPAAALVVARNRPLLVAGLVAFSLVGVWSNHDGHRHEEYRSAAAWVAADAQPGDGIVFAPAYLRPAFGYYARVGEPLYPPIAWSDSDLLRGPPDLAGVAAAQRIWLVEAHSRQLPSELAAALAKLRPLEMRDYVIKDLRVTLLAREARP
jgi:mannosyltransferase